MKFIGKTTIHPILFFSGKILGYMIWVLFALALLNIYIIFPAQSDLLKYISIGISILGLVFVVFSSINLGSSTRLGLPDENTAFKTGGVYKFSRNPMYVGFNLLTIAGIILSFNVIVAVIGLYSITIYHFIILGEEKFLAERFGTEYTEYKKRVKRYFLFF